MRAALLTLVAAAVMAGGDARRRPVAATVGYAVTLFAMLGWVLSRSPAFRPMAPGVGDTALALALTLGAAVLGGLAARRLSDALTRPTPAEAL